MQFHRAEISPRGNYSFIMSKTKENFEYCLIILSRCFRKWFD